VNSKEKKNVNTCPSAIISKTWYCPPLCSTIVMAISITGAKDVGPTITKHKQNALEPPDRMFRIRRHG
jgi:hypothetical protein